MGCFDSPMHFLESSGFWAIVYFAHCQYFNIWSVAYPGFDITVGVDFVNGGGGRGKGRNTLKV